MAGRKSLKDELGILRRYADLTEPYFKVLKARLNSKNKKEQDWAVEQLTKAYTKMIPQQVGGLDGEPIQVQWLQSPSNISPASGQTTSTIRIDAG